MADIVLTGNTSGAITVAAPAVAGTNTLTLPASTSTLATTADITGPTFSATASATQSIADNTSTKIAFNTEVFDTNSNYDTGTYRFTPTVAGYYQFNAHVLSGGSSTTEIWNISISKNASEYLQGSNGQTKFATVGSQSNASGIFYMNGSSDYVEAYIYQRSGGGALSTQAGSVNTSNFTGALIRKA